MKVKTTILLIITLVSLSAISAMACNCQGNKASGKKAEFKAPLKSEASASSILKTYLDLRTVLATDRDEDIHDAATALVNAFNTAETTAKKTKSNKDLSTLLSKMKKTSQQIASSKSIDVARDSFGKLSDMLVDYATSYISSSDAGKYQLFYCGMAEHYWFQKSGEEIGNPYYGKQMPGCGEKTNLSSAYKNCCGK